VDEITKQEPHLLTKKIIIPLSLMKCYISLLLTFPNFCFKVLLVKSLSNNMMADFVIGGEKFYL